MKVVNADDVSLRTSISLLLLVFLSLVVGCGVEERESLYESDHTVPAHWPNDVADSIVKMEERVTRLHNQPDQKTTSELADIIGWVPEIAADSELTEEEWAPLYEASTRLTNRVRSGGKQMNEALLAEVTAFRDLIN